MIIKYFLLFFICASSLASQSVRIVVPYAVGGNADGLSRLIQDRLQQDLRFNVILENRPGGGTVIANTLVAQAPSDQIVLLYQSISLPVSQILVPPTYDPRALRPLVKLGSSPMLLTVPASSALFSIREWQRLAKNHSITYASAGMGSGTHIVSEIFRSALGLNMIHVPYRGQALAIVDVITGKVDSAFLFPQVALPYVRSGKLLPVAIMGDRRSTMYLDVPTFAENGFSGLGTADRPWHMILVNQTVHQTQISQIQQSLISWLRSIAGQQSLANLGVEVDQDIVPGPGFLDREKQRYVDLVNELGLKPE